MRNQARGQSLSSELSLSFYCLLSMCALPLTLRHGRNSGDHESRNAGKHAYLHLSANGEFCKLSGVRSLAIVDVSHADCWDDIDDPEVRVNSVHRYVGCLASVLASSDNELKRSRTYAECDSDVQVFGGCGFRGRRFAVFR